MDDLMLVYWVGLGSGVLLAILGYNLSSMIRARRSRAAFYSGKSKMNLSIKHLL